MLIAMLVIAAPAVAPSGAHAAGCTFGGASWGTKKPKLADGIVKLVNDYRGKRGLSRVSRSPTLTKAAMWKSGHMARYDYFSHEDAAPASRSTGERLLACGYRGSSWAENIAFGYTSAGQVMQGWINSPGHRENLDNPRYNAVGVGAVKAPGSGPIYWSQAFGVQGSESAPGPRRDEPARVSRTSQLKPRQQQAVRFNMSNARPTRIVVKALNRTGARRLGVRLHCNGRRIAAGAGRRGRPAVIRRKLPKGRCAAMVVSGRQNLRYKITLVLR
ncbi:MAG: CAP domain-containing protein [Thermoleophilia bacterium]|nr:CAP domain-containing protein [Thermoleophilia bacterium]